MATNLIAGKTYARVWLIVLGAVLLLLGVLGFVVAHPLGVATTGNPTLNLEGGELWVHLVLGIVTLGVAFGLRDDGALNTVALLFGVVYLIVGAIGFAMPTIGIWHVGTIDNVLHLLVGVVTLGAWWMSRDVSVTGATPGRPSV